LQKSFEAHGIEYFLVDGAKSNQMNYKILEQIATQTSLKLICGLKADSDLKLRLKVVPIKLLEEVLVKIENIRKMDCGYGADKIILGADANNEKSSCSGWLEDSNEDLIPFIQDYQNKGIQYVICTDIAKDGMLEGPSFDLYAKILAEAKGIKLIASGGISTFDELQD
jgi:phosphoribosylformimino-5-aminoimidazole carboxamide ribotide isomerase